MIDNVQNNDLCSKAVSRHYSTLAESYDQLWEHSKVFQGWMCDKMLEGISLPAAPIIADVGGGTGIYSNAILDRYPQANVYIIDPSAEMLSKAPSRTGIKTICTSAESAVDQLVDAGICGCDLIIIKEAVHHFSELEATLHSLSDFLNVNGTLVIAMLPKKIEYPLFDTALSRFTQLQPDPNKVLSVLRHSGLKAVIRKEGYLLKIPLDRWVSMVSERFMSLLSTFSDYEIAQGIDEILGKYGDRKEVAFKDNFMFIVGVRPAS